MPAPNANPRPDDVEIPQWVSRHRGLVSAAPRWIKLNVMRYVDAYGKERLWEWASRTTKGAAAVDAAVVVAVLHSRKTGLRQLVLVEQYVKRALLAAIRRRYDCYARVLVLMLLLPLLLLLLLLLLLR